MSTYREELRVGTKVKVLTHAVLNKLKRDCEGHFFIVESINYMHPHGVAYTLAWRKKDNRFGKPPLSSLMMFFRESELQAIPDYPHVVKFEELPII